MIDYTPFCAPRHKDAPRSRIPNERLFACVRASDLAPVWLELRQQGAAGWEVHVFERPEWYEARGGFATRALAVEWSQQARMMLECAHSS
jgi:hypothetical protein